MKRLAATFVLSLAVLAACQEGIGGDPEPVGAAKIEADRAKCERRGGRYATGPNGLMTCFTTPRDAGKQCRQATDCESACLARSGTCAPVQPLMGCNEVFNAGGVRVNQCVE